MSSVSVAEAAKLLGVGVARIHQRIANGSLHAERVGSQWVIDEASLIAVAEASVPGRPLSERSAWALLACSLPDQREFDALMASERTRARDRLGRLLAGSSPDVEPSEMQAHADTVLLRSWLRNRATRRLYRASPRDLPDLRKDPRLTLSGLSHPLSGIASGDLVEGYVRAGVLQSLVTEYLLSSAAPDDEANVVLHVASTVVRRIAEVPPLLLAADLAEHRRPREEGRAVELLRDLAADCRR